MWLRNLNEPLAFFIVQRHLLAPSAREDKKRLLYERTLANRAKQSAPLFFMIQLQRLDCSVVSLLPARQKAPLRQKLHPPHIQDEPLPLLFI